MVLWVVSRSQSLRPAELPEDGISSNHRVQDPDVRLPPEPECAFRRLVDHVGQIFIGFHVLVIDDPEPVVDHVSSGTQRLVHGGDLEHERFPVPF